MKYGPADAGARTPFGSRARFVGIAQKNGIAIRARKSGDAFVSVMTRWLPFTFTPETGDLSDPTMSEKNGTAGDCIFGSASRSKAALKFAAVTAWPLENFVKPALTVKSYTLPPELTFGKPAAASGMSWEPFAPLASG